MEGDTPGCTHRDHWRTQEEGGRPHAGERGLRRNHTSQHLDREHSASKTEKTDLSCARPPPQGYVVRAPSADEHRRYRRNPANWCVVAATLMFVFLSCMNRRKLFKITCQSHHVLVRNKLCRGGFSKSCWQIEGFLKKYSKRSNDGSLEMSGDSSIDPVFGPEKRAGSFQS